MNSKLSFHFVTIVKYSSRFGYFISFYTFIKVEAIYYSNKKYFLLVGILKVKPLEKLSNNKMTLTFNFEMLQLTII